MGGICVYSKMGLAPVDDSHSTDTFQPPFNSSTAFSVQNYRSKIHLSRLETATGKKMQHSVTIPYIIIHIFYINVGSIF